jgi:DNA polymerase III subunit chi
VPPQREGGRVKRLGFYLSGEKPVEQVLPLIARKAMQAGERLLVVSSDAEQIALLDHALWEAAPEDFLAHGHADAAHPARQPILLSDRCEAANGASMVALADGVWREEAEAYERGFLFFDDSGRDRARPVWSAFDSRSDLDREFHVLEHGKWVRKR